MTINVYWRDLGCNSSCLYIESEYCTNILIAEIIRVSYSTEYPFRVGYVTSSKSGWKHLKTMKEAKEWVELKLGIN